MSFPIDIKQGLVIAVLFLVQAVGALNVSTPQGAITQATPSIKPTSQPAFNPLHVQEIPVPNGYVRVSVQSGSFGEWLRQRPLKPQGSLVHLYNGQLKANQEVHYAVLDMDIGDKDLQQCADAVIRLRAEYWYQNKQYDKITFHATSGDEMPFAKWAQGYRFELKSNSLTLKKSAEVDDSYASFRKYLDQVFAFAGTLSLSKELKSVANVQDIAVGDVFIQGGSPGHAEIVLDVAANSRGEKIFLLAQSYMPAQEMHVLKNLNDAALNPWYSAAFGETLDTPEWTFKKGDLKRFP